MSRRKAPGARSFPSHSAYIALLHAALASRPRDPLLMARLSRAVEARERVRRRPYEARVRAGELSVLDLESGLRAGHDVRDALVRASIRLADAYLDLDRACCAAVRLQRARSLAPADPDVLDGLARALWRQDRPAAAEAVLHELLTIDPDRPDALGLLAWCLRRRLALDEALATSQRALARDPDCVPALRAAVAVHLARGELERAGALLEHALALEPDAPDVRLQEAFRRLVAGDFEGGWPFYESRFSDVPGEIAEPIFAQPRWDGSDLAGRTILVDPEQGAGDVIQFVRFLPALQERGATVLVPASCDLANLLATCDGIDLLIDPGTVGQVAFDCYLPLGSLPLRLALRLSDLPYRTRYLRADPERARHWKGRLEAAGSMGRFRVGLVWGGNSAMLEDFNRSFDAAEYAPLAGVPAVDFVSLQIGRRPSPEATQALRLIDWTAELVDYADTAALATNLDLVIAVDTSVAHLAGALGLPVWTLVRTDADYRWLLDRADSPWYPTMRLFRQREPLAWAPVIERVRVALGALVQAGRSAPRRARR